jgi:hypothetical protein
MLPVRGKRKNARFGSGHFFSLVGRREVIESVKCFVRVTKLSNIGGRADYIANPERQEHIVAASPLVDWKPYRDFERDNQKTAKRNNEGREVIVALPNEWEKLPSGELTNRVQALAEIAAGKPTDMQWAVHWNKTHTNLHMHVIFSERQREKDAGRWDRDIYLTEDGKVARSKAVRTKNPDGTDKPPIHRKGEEKGGFTAKDTKYKSKAWVQDIKGQLREQLERYGVRIGTDAPLREYHEGKGRDAPRISEKNAVIREVNAQVEAFRIEHGRPPNKYPPKMIAALIELLKKRRYPVVCKVAGKWLVGSEATAKEALEKMKMSAASEKVINNDNGQAGKPPVKPFDPAAVLATRDHYARTYLLYQYKMKTMADTAIIEKADALKQAAEQLPREARLVRMFTMNLSDCKFWQTEKKKQIQSDIDGAVSRCEALIKTMERCGVSVYQDNAPIDCKNPVKERVDEIIRRAAKFELPKMEREAEAELKKQKILAMAKDVRYEDVEAAYRAFENEMGEIPADNHKAAYGALQAPYRPDFSASIQDRVAVEKEIAGIVKKIGPQPVPEPKRERPQQQTQGRGRRR